MVISAEGVLSLSHCPLLAHAHPAIFYFCISLRFIYFWPIKCRGDPARFFKSIVWCDILLVGHLSKQAWNFWIFPWFPWVFGLCVEILRGHVLVLVQTEEKTVVSMQKVLASCIHAFMTLVSRHDDFSLAITMTTIGSLIAMVSRPPKLLSNIQGWASKHKYRKARLNVLKEA